MGSETLARSLCRRMVCPAVQSLGSFGGDVGDVGRWAMRQHDGGRSDGGQLCVSKND